MNLQEAARLTEEEARKHLEAIRWPDGPACPHCGNVGKSYAIGGEAARDGLYECGECKEQFTVTVGTVMEKTKIPLSKWVMAFHMICAHKKGVSARQLQRDLGLGSYRTAWHLAHRIRLAMREHPLADLLRGTVEVDETYVGGKPRKAARAFSSKQIRSAKQRASTGRGTHKVAVVALVERGGRAVSRPVERVDAKHLKGAIRESVDRSAAIHTDEWPAYRGIGSEFAGGHETVNHHRGEYARGNVTSNSVESYFSLLKRGVYGTFHHVSKKHLHRYCDEFSFRWNTRDLEDSAATKLAVRGAEGKRLMYKPEKGTATQ